MEVKKHLPSPDGVSFQINKLGDDTLGKSLMWKNTLNLLLAIS
jgi:hypothetical protein